MVKTVKTGIKEYDELPSSTWRRGRNIDALRACYVKNNKPGFIEKIAKKIGFKDIANRCMKRREKNKQRAKKRLDISAERYQARKEIEKQFNKCKAVK